MGVPPIAGWFISWKMPLKWMMNRGTPMLGTPHICTIFIDFIGLIVFHWIYRYHAEITAKTESSINGGLQIRK